MREAIGGAWIFTIVIVFIVLFSGYLAVSVNYSKAFRVKNGIINIIEQNEGMNSKARTEISEYLDGYGYFVYGNCKDAKGYDELVGGQKKYRYCVSTKAKGEGTFKKTYYYVTVYFKLDLPIFGSLFTFPVTGESKAVYFANDKL